MRPLTAAEIITVWEQADQRHPLDRVLALLAMVFPDRAMEQLAALPLGQRDTLLIALREQTLGPRFKGCGQCPQCDEQAEFEVTSTELLAAALQSPEKLATDLGSPVPDEELLAQDDYQLRFRLPNSLDLATVVQCRKATQGYDLLLQRCVLEARRAETRIPVTDLPESVTALLVATMAERDPMAEIQLDLECAACTRHWQLILDVASFFWTEISTQAKRLLNEVHILARAYAWREADILAMSDQRRCYYLDRVSL